MAQDNTITTRIKIKMSNREKVIVAPIWAYYKAMLTIKGIIDMTLPEYKNERLEARLETRQRTK